VFFYLKTPVSVTLEFSSLRLKHLEIILSQLSPHPNPNLQLEEYTIDSKSAKNLIYIAEFVHEDIYNKKVVDLGCGTGQLSIAAALFGASLVVGVDINKENISLARDNTKTVGVTVEYVVGDIESLSGHFDTTITNPPFGCWKRGADVSFLKKAIEISDVVYSLHKRSAPNRKFLSRTITSLGGKLDEIHEMDMTIPHTFTFHRKKKHIVSGDLYRTITTS
jgi:putative methylase